MKYSIQGNLVDTESVTVAPTMTVTCRACNKSADIIGMDIPVDCESVDGWEIEDSIEQSLAKSGWKDLICPRCIENDPNIVKKYNDSEDNYED